MSHNQDDPLGYGPQALKDPPFTARMRFHQSWYRALLLLAACSLACAALLAPVATTPLPPAPSTAAEIATVAAPSPIPPAGSPMQPPAATNPTLSPSAPEPPATAPDAGPCPALPPPPPGSSLTVSDEATLRARAYDAASGVTILVQPGVYNMQDFVHIVNNGVALRGASGDRSEVILDFGGMTGGHFGILVEADDVTIADLTIREANDHGVSIQGSDRPVLYNLHILDTGDQLVKVNPAGDGSQDGLLACSRLEYTSSAPDSYTNGISAHDAHRWVVRDNQWRRIRTPTDDPVPAILFWSGSSDTIVERNLLVDCYQGISFGNASHGAGDHSGGIVRNNFIYASQPHDVVIEMVHANGWLVAHNTALLLNPAGGLTWGMEARYSDSVGTFAYNLTNMPILVDREGAQGASSGDITSAASDWFVHPPGGDLHLRPTAAAAIDQAAALAQVSDDYDGQARPAGAAADVGADEYFEPDFWVYLPLLFRAPAYLVTE